MAEKKLLEEIEALKAENAKLKEELATSRAQSSNPSLDEAEVKHEDKEETKPLSIVVVGASGDLARKKTYPALFALFCRGLLPLNVIIAGYARSELDEKEFHKRASSDFGKKVEDFENKKNAFLSRCWYFAGQYDAEKDWAAFDKALKVYEQKEQKGTSLFSNRIFYLAIPPSIFVTVANGVQKSALSQSGWNRVVVEKPFGMDLESSNKMSRELAALFKEEQLFRIDHYLGKDMVQNLMVLRFANQIFEPLWSRDYVKAVMITFKEDFGTKGRGGYFDEFGIIRDVMQNHLLQILSLLAMEPPVSLHAEEVRNEKVKLLRAIPPIELKDVVLGQYGADPKGKEQAYLDDPTVPKGSVTPTFATAVLRINNSRWRDVPFILKCGKALNERKAEVRVQFRNPLAGLFPEAPPNELVLRVQPDQSIYFKATIKKPGLTGGLAVKSLDLDYNYSFDTGTIDAIPDAYERLIYDVIRGDHNLFVRSDELVAAWKIFTPLLHRIEREKIRPEPYVYGSRGPASSDELLKREGYIPGPEHPIQKSQDPWVSRGGVPPPGSPPQKSASGSSSSSTST